jgi:peptide/nickel transport system permease protein
MTDRPDTPDSMRGQQPEQPVDLLSARAGARPKGFLEWPSVRKFRRNRIALVALAIICVYFVAAMVVMLPVGVFSRDMREVSQRIAGSSLPGLGATADFSARVEQVDFFLGSIEKSLRASDPASALDSLRFAERRPADWPAERFEEALEAAGELFDDYDVAEEEYDDLTLEADALEDELRAARAAPGGARDTARIAEIEAELEALGPDLAAAEQALDAALTALEARIEEMIPTPEGFAGLRYQVRLLGGTDRQGRSLLLRGIYSIKTAVQIGVVTALLSVILGTILGAAAGFFGGAVDHFVVWLYSTISAIPYIVWLVVIAFVVREMKVIVPFTGGKQIGQTLVPVYLAFCMTFWVGPCRVVRGEAMKIKHLDYVQSAISIGAGPTRLLMRHVLPNTAYLMFINFSLLFVGAIKGEVILSYLGLGVQGQPSWGIMIRDSADEVVRGFFWQIGIATVFMFVLVLAFNILSDALQDALDPKHAQGA